MTVPTLSSWVATHVNRAALRTCEREFFSALGGVYGTEVFPGNIDLTNFPATGLGLTLAHRALRSTILAMAPLHGPQGAAEWYPALTDMGSGQLGLEWSDGIVTRVDQVSQHRFLVQSPVLIDKLQFLHWRATAIAASENVKAWLRVNDRTVAWLSLPEATDGIAATLLRDPSKIEPYEPYEWSVNLALNAGDWVDVIFSWDGTYGSALRLAASPHLFEGAVSLLGKARIIP